MTVIRMVWAEDDQHAIGKDGDLPWHIPADLAVFKAETINSLMIMGRNTWYSIGRPLPKRRSVVISRQEDFTTAYSEVTIVHSVQEALDLIKATGSKLVSIAGGAHVYQTFMPYATELVVTRVAGNHGGDTFMQPIDLTKFKCVSQNPGKDGDYDFVVERYVRK